MEDIQHVFDLNVSNDSKMMFALNGFTDKKKKKYTNDSDIWTEMAKP